MGSSASVEVKRQIERNKTIDRQMKLDFDAAQHVLKILLLGAGDSGKSTVLKQMRILHAEGFSTEDLKGKRALVHANAIECMASILKAMQQLHISLKDSLSAHAELVVKAIDDEELTTISPMVGESLKLLWIDPSVQECFKRSSEYQLHDSAKYFLDALHRIMEPNYIPTLDDILRIRVRTVGIVEMSFKCKKQTFRVFDVGGQRSERRKWIHYFDDTDALLFLASLSEYDQLLYEDGKTNRMLESLTLFATVCNSKWFLNACVILFLNKKDLFTEKIKRVPLTVAFPNYTGDMTYDACLAYISAEYVKQSQDPHKVVKHVTCATDTNQIEVIVNSSLEMMIEHNLKKTGML